MPRRGTSAGSLRPPARYLWRSRGVIATGVGTVLLVALWLAFAPDAMAAEDNLGQLTGTLAIWLMAVSLRAISVGQRAGAVFSGIGGQFWWHRLGSTIGLILAIVHPRIMITHGEDLTQGSIALVAITLLEKVAIVLAIWAFMAPGTRAARWRGPLGWLARIRYDIWRIVHVTLGFYLLVGIWHGYVDALAGTWNPVLLSSYVVVCAVGVWAFVDRVVARPIRNRISTATVVEVQHLGQEGAMVTIRPDRRRGYSPGSFVYLGRPPSRDRPHPFTITALRDDGALELRIKAVGAGTARLLDELGEGERVHLSAPQSAAPEPAHAGRSVWVAGGSGITPILAAVRQFPTAGPPGSVALLWSRRSSEDTATVRELRDTARTHDGFSVGFVDTTTEARITAADVVALGGVPATELHVRLCGPAPMVADLQAGLLEAGVPRRNLQIDTFSFR